MTNGTTSGAPISFQGWELRPAERKLLVGGDPVKLGPRAFDILVALARRPGQVVTKSELMDAVWSGVVVEDNNISVQVSYVRKAIGDDAIGTVQGVGYQLCARPVDRTPASPASAPAPASLRAMALHTELIGREQDLRELVALLEGSRLTSVVGAGGVGKTSLARAALVHTPQFAQAAVHLIELATVSEPGQVAALIATSLSINVDSETDALEEVALALADRADLIVIDNCEHLLDEVARCVRTLMPAAPAVRWLATSQAPLHVPGEIVYRLEPLAVPPAGLSAAAALEYGSVALLRQRAVAADRHFCLADTDVEAAVFLCAQLDGLPLAIEMAAARVATFGLADVRRRLDQRLRLLTGPKDGNYRYRTLQATFDWSYGLLSGIEQAVFRRLEPFLGGFRADMAQQIASDNDGTVDVAQFLETLSLLVDKSLVQRCVDAPGRFMLLEGAREYARTRLNASGETARVRQRHMRAVAEWFADAQVDADVMHDAQWVERYAPERHNALAALAWAIVEGAADDLARLVTAVTSIDSFLCQQAEILHCDVPLDLLSQAEPTLRARAFLELGWVHYLDGDRDVGARLMQEAHEIFCEFGPVSLAYRALAQLTRLHEARPGMADAAHACWALLGRMDERAVPLRTRLFCGISCGRLHRPGFGVEQMQELGRLAAAARFETMAAIAVCNLTDKLLIAGREKETVAVVREMLPLADKLPRARAIVLNNLVMALVRLGRASEAYEPARRAFQAMPSVAHFLLSSFAVAAVREGRMTDAAVLHGCSMRVRADRHEEPDMSDGACIDEVARGLSAAFEASELAQLMGIGASMSAAQALAFKVFALDPTAPSRGAVPATAPGRASSPDLV